MKICGPIAIEFENTLETFRTATAAFLAQLEIAIVQSPDQWRGWKYLELAQGPSTPKDDPVSRAQNL